MGSLWNSSPIFIVAELAWITSTGKRRTWVNARNWKRHTKKKQLLKSRTRNRKSISVTNLELTSSCPPQAAVCSTSLQYFSNSSRKQDINTCIKAAGTQTYYVMWNIYHFSTGALKYSRSEVPVVYMSPVVGLVRKGRKSSGWFLICSAVQVRSSLTLIINSG